jgi:hypothetical protein
MAAVGIDTTHPGVFTPFTGCATLANMEVQLLTRLNRQGPALVLAATSPFATTSTRADRSTPAATSAGEGARLAIQVGVAARPTGTTDAIANHTAAATTGAGGIATAYSGSLGLLVPSRQTAIAGFVAALKAQDAADRAVNPNYPGLAATEVNPELTQSQDVIVALRLNHDTVRGPEESLGHPAILSYSPTRAVVQTCSPAGGAITYGANGRPLPGVLGTAPAAVLTGVMVPGAENWMLQDFAVKVVASCSAP